MEAGFGTTEACRDGGGSPVTGRSLDVMGIRERTLKGHAEVNSRGCDGHFVRVRRSAFNV